MPDTQRPELKPELDSGDYFKCLHLTMIFFHPTGLHKHRSKPNIKVFPHCILNHVEYISVRSSSNGSAQCKSVGSLARASSPAQHPQAHPVTCSTPQLESDVWPPPTLFSLPELTEAPQTQPVRARTQQNIANTTRLLSDDSVRHTQAQPRIRKRASKQASKQASQQSKPTSKLASHQASLLASKKTY